MSNIWESLGCVLVYSFFTCLPVLILLLISVIKGKILDQQTVIRKQIHLTLFWQSWIGCGAMLLFLWMTGC